MFLEVRKIFFKSYLIVDFMISYPGTIFAKIKNVRFAQLYKNENWKLLKVFYSWEWSLNGQYLPRVLESNFRSE